MQFLQNLSNNYKRAFLRLGKNLNGTYFVVRSKKIPKWVIVLSIPTMIYLYSLYFYNRIVKKPSVYYNDKSSRMVLMYESLIDILETKYFPTLWASNTHLNTYIGSIFRRNPDILFKREMMHMSDQGLIALDWHVPHDPQIDDNSPVVLFMPGLTGSSESSYIRQIVESLSHIGIQSVVMIYRGLLGLPLMTPKGYSGAFTDDLREVVNRLRERYPTRDFYAVGYSLGSNILCKYIGEEGENIAIKAAVSVGNPYNFLKSSQKLESNPVYSHYLVKGLVKYVHDNKEVLSQDERFVQSLNNILTCTSLREFDEMVTSVFGGYLNADDYYSNASCTNVLEKVRTPLLLISARDDPVVEEEGIPIQQALSSEYIMLVLTEMGGHLGFLEGWWPKEQNWSDRLIVRFFSGLLGVTNDINS